MVELVSGDTWPAVWSFLLAPLTGSLVGLGTDRVWCFVVTQSLQGKRLMTVSLGRTILTERIKGLHSCILNWSATASLAAYYFDKDDYKR